MSIACDPRIRRKLLYTMPGTPTPARCCCRIFTELNRERPAKTIVRDYAIQGGESKFPPVSPFAGRPRFLAFVSGCR
jgi:hypothetical protein